MKKRKLFLKNTIIFYHNIKILILNEIFINNINKKNIENIIKKLYIKYTKLLEIL